MKMSIKIEIKTTPMLALVTVTFQLQVKASVQINGSPYLGIPQSYFSDQHHKDDMIQYSGG